MAATMRISSHRVLNARQDRLEAQIVAAAGKQGLPSPWRPTWPVAAPISHSAQESRKLGGLHVIALNLNSTHSGWTANLFGRAARQGDPGSGETLLSLQDQ